MTSNQSIYQAFFSSSQGEGRFRGHRKAGITLVELLIVIIIIGLSLASIIGLVNLGIKSVDKTRLEVVGINLAREGVEGMYQIRNTNRQRRGGDKDGCRLKTDPMKDEGSAGCINDVWMGSGFYTISLTGDEGSKYYIMGPRAAGFNLAAYNEARDEPFALCVLNGIRSPCQAGQQSENTNKYYRQVRGLGLFEKNSPSPTAGGNQISCPSGSTASCSDTSAKEYRFCVDVEYKALGVGNIQLCSMLTNFRE